MKGDRVTQLDNQPSLSPRKLRVSRTRTRGYSSEVSPTATTCLVNDNNRNILSITSDNYPSRSVEENQPIHIMESNFQQSLVSSPVRRRRSSSGTLQRSRSQRGKNLKYNTSRRRSLPVIFEQEDSGILVSSSPSSSPHRRKSKYKLQSRPISVSGAVIGPSYNLSSVRMKGSAILLDRQGIKKHMSTLTDGVVADGEVGLIPAPFYGSRPTSEVYSVIPRKSHLPRYGFTIQRNPYTPPLRNHNNRRRSNAIISGYPHQVRRPHTSSAIEAINKRLTEIKLESKDSKIEVTVVDDVSPTGGSTQRESLSNRSDENESISQVDDSVYSSSASCSSDSEEESSSSESTSSEWTTDSSYSASDSDDSDTDSSYTTTSASSSTSSSSDSDSSSDDSSSDESSSDEEDTSMSGSRSTFMSDTSDTDTASSMTCTGSSSSAATSSVATGMTESSNKSETSDRTRSSSRSERSSPERSSSSRSDGSSTSRSEGSSSRSSSITSSRTSLESGTTSKTSSSRAHSRTSFRSSSSSPIKSRGKNSSASSSSASHGSHSLECSPCRTASSSSSPKHSHSKTKSNKSNISRTRGEYIDLDNIERSRTPEQNDESERRKPMKTNENVGSERPKPDANVPKDKHHYHDYHEYTNASVDDDVQSMTSTPAVIVRTEDRLELPSNVSSACAIM